MVLTTELRPWHMLKSCGGLKERDLGSRVELSVGIHTSPIDLQISFREKGWQIKVKNPLPNQPVNSWKPVFLTVWDQVSEFITEDKGEWFAQVEQNMVELLQEGLPQGTDMEGMVDGTITQWGDRALWAPNNVTVSLHSLSTLGWLEGTQVHFGGLWNNVLSWCIVYMLQRLLLSLEVQLVDMPRQWWRRGWKTAVKVPGGLGLCLPHFLILNIGYSAGAEEMLGKHMLNKCK